MVEIPVLHKSLEPRIRLEAARIHRLRRHIARSNAIRELDRQIVREAVASGVDRGHAFSIADEFMKGIAARLVELDSMSGCPAKSNVLRINREVAA